MKENFTATQKEVVARKMGYNGPMQMFDEFLMSRPSDAQRYASITSKFAENMAKGGMVGYAQGGAVSAASLGVLSKPKRKAVSDLVSSCKEKLAVKFISYSLKCYRFQYKH